ncbi:frataxin [Ogataea polymorpha]|uniref:frataxin n=1 Tax=Ogataea polymorpha TaxID=460523 RepID=UPI0007F3D8D3|nr:frataxin [Ogataea polymorpha]OBA15687.1 frataxin [Ogataea polymorpha]
MRNARTLLRSGRFLTRAVVLTARPAVRGHNVQMALPTCQSARCNSISARTDGADIPESVRSLTMEQYDTSASETLETIYCDLDGFFDEHNISDADVEESAGILTLNTPQGSYVLNKQPPNKQLWLSSPISGPKRFDLLDGEWISIRDGVKLHDMLEEEMTQIFGDFSFSGQF